MWKRQKVGATYMKKAGAEKAKGGIEIYMEKAGARCVEKAGVRCVEKAKVGARYVEKRRGWSDNGTHLFVRVQGSVGEEGVVLDLAHGLVAVGSTAAAQSELWVSVDHLSVDGWAESGLHTILYCTWCTISTVHVQVILDYVQQCLCSL